MPKCTSEQIYAAARALLPTLNADTRRQVEALLARAERGQPTDRDLLELLTREETTRQQMRALLKEKGEITEQVLGGFSPMPGEPSPTRPGEIFICPEEGCGYRYVIGEANERPVPCPQHPTAELIREHREEG